MFENIESINKDSNIGTTTWWLHDGPVLYRGWFYATSNEEDTWYNLFDKSDKSPIEYDVRIGSEQFTYIKFQVFSYLEVFYPYNYDSDVSHFHQEKRLPTQKQLALHKLKHPPMFPADDGKIKYLDYLIELIDPDLTWHSLCDWEAYYCFKE